METKKSLVTFIVDKTIYKCKNKNKEECLQYLKQEFKFEAILSKHLLEFTSKKIENAAIVKKCRVKKINFKKMGLKKDLKEGANYISTPPDDYFYNHPAVRFKALENGEGRYIWFQAKDSYDLHIGLFKNEFPPDDGTHSQPTKGYVGICFGGWGNKRCALYQSQVKDYLIKDTHMKNKNCITKEYKNFTVVFMDTNIRIYDFKLYDEQFNKTDDKEPILEFNHSESFNQFQSCAILNRPFGKEPAHWIFYK